MMLRPKLLCVPRGVPSLAPGFFFFRQEKIQELKKELFLKCMEVQVVIQPLLNFEKTARRLKVKLGGATSSPACDVSCAMALGQYIADLPEAHKVTSTSSKWELLLTNFFFWFYVV